MNAISFLFSITAPDLITLLFLLFSAPVVTTILRSLRDNFRIMCSSHYECWGDLSTTQPSGGFQTLTFSIFTYTFTPLEQCFLYNLMIFYDLVPCLCVCSHGVLHCRPLIVSTLLCSPPQGVFRPLVIFTLPCCPLSGIPLVESILWYSTPFIISNSLVFFTV